MKLFQKKIKESNMTVEATMGLMAMGTILIRSSMILVSSRVRESRDREGDPSI